MMLAFGNLQFYCSFFRFIAHFLGDDDEFVQIGQFPRMNERRMFLTFSSSMPLVKEKEQ